MHASKLHAREPRDPVAARRRAEREKAMSDKPLSHGGGESSGGIVPASVDAGAGSVMAGTSLPKVGTVYVRSAPTQDVTGCGKSKFASRRLIFIELSIEFSKKGIVVPERRQRLAD
jgi:hypothetical protein